MDVGDKVFRLAYTRNTIGKNECHCLCALQGSSLLKQQIGAAKNTKWNVRAGMVRRPTGILFVEGQCNRMAIDRRLR